MNAEALRATLDRLEYEIKVDSKPDALIADLRVATAAARLIALPILERDKKLVEQIRRLLWDISAGHIMPQIIGETAKAILTVLAATDPEPPPKLSDFDYETEGFGGT